MSPLRPRTGDKSPAAAAPCGPPGDMSPLRLRTGDKSPAAAAPCCPPGDMSPLQPRTGDKSPTVGRYVATSAPDRRQVASRRAICRHFGPGPATSRQTPQRLAARRAICRHFGPGPATSRQPSGDMSPLPLRTGDKSPAAGRDDAGKSRAALGVPPTCLKSSGVLPNTRTKTAQASRLMSSERQ